MPEESLFQDLIRRVQAGDERAAAELVRTYEPAIRRAVRLRLRDTRLRQRLDSLDICQSVLGSFFVRAALGRYELNEPADLLRLLTALVRNKVAGEAAYQAAQRRSFRRTAAELPEETLAGGASPSRQLAARELLEETRRRLSADERGLLERREQGREWVEIAGELGGSPEALRKKLARALDRVAHDLGLDGPGPQ